MFGTILFFAKKCIEQPILINSININLYTQKPNNENIKIFGHDAHDGNYGVQSFFM